MDSCRCNMAPHQRFSGQSERPAKAADRISICGGSNGFGINRNMDFCVLRLSFVVAKYLKHADRDPLAISCWLKALSITSYSRICQEAVI